jgi:hypothetical protein
MEKENVNYKVQEGIMISTLKLRKLLITFVQHSFKF